MRQKRVYVNVSAGEIASIDDIMALISRLPYLEMIEFAGRIEGDADKIADAVKAWYDSRPADEDD